GTHELSIEHAPLLKRRMKAVDGEAGANRTSESGLEHRELSGRRWTTANRRIPEREPWDLRRSLDGVGGIRITARDELSILRRRQPKAPRGSGAISCGDLDRVCESGAGDAGEA